MWRSGKGRRDEGRYVTFFSEESNKEPVCDVKAAGIKLEDRTAVVGVDHPSGIKSTDNKRLLLGEKLAASAA